jgi:diguanylate cyclase (GGDEF)-like protein
MTITQSSARMLRNAALMLGLLVAALGGSVLTGWILDIAALRSGLPFGAAMRANSAVGFLLCGMALAALCVPGFGNAGRIFATVTGVAVAAAGILTLSQDLAGWDLGIDQWLVRDTTGTARTTIPGRMSPPTAFSFLLVGIALLAASRPVTAQARTPVILALSATAILIGGIALLGHASERLLDFRFLSYSRIASYAALGFVLLGCGLLALVRSEEDWAWSLDAVTTGGFVVGIAAMVSTAGISYQFTSALRSDAEQVSRTLEVLKEIQKLNSIMDDFTISAGRYIITRDERTLAGREPLKEAIRNSIARLHKVADAEGQKRHLAQIEELHAKRIAMSDDIIAGFRQRIQSGRLPVAGEASPLGQEYPALGVEIDRMLDLMEAKEYAALERRQKQADETSRKTFLLLPLGVFVGLTMLALGLFFLNSGARERLRAQAALARKSKRLEVLHEIDLAIIAAKAPAQIAEAVLPRLRDLLGVPRVVVNMFDLEKHEAEWLAAVGRQRGHVGSGIRFSMEVMGDLEGLKSGEMQLIDVSALRQRPEAEALLASDVRWYKVVPMIAGGELIGGLSFGGPSAEFPSEQVEIAKEVAAQLAIAIAQSRQQNRIARLSRVKGMQSSINSAVARTHERQALLDEVCRVAVEQGGFRAAWLGWHDAAALRIRPIASAGVLDGFLELVHLSTDVSLEKAESPAVRVILGGKPEVTNDLRASPRLVFRSEAVRRGFLSMMHLPLKIHDATEGVLVLFAPEAAFFDQEEVDLLVELVTDVSVALDSLQKSDRLNYLAYYDPLTGLPNRILFHDRLSHSLHARGGEPRLIAVVLLDLERFRRMNETLGRQSGDKLLQEVGARLQRANETTARVGADVYGLTLRGARTAAEVNRALEAILAACFAEPFVLEGEELRVACRAGVALHPDDGADADTLLRNAEAALKRSKAADDRIVFYAAEMNARVAEALAIENKLRRAIERREFVLHYQPKVSLDDARITGLEALIRWQDPDKGLVPPGRFIPILEETGMIVEVGRWAVEQTFADLAAWAAKGLDVPRVAVNVSAIQLQRKDFVYSMMEEIRRGGDHPEWLELEITEGLVMRNVEDSIGKLSILRRMGVTVAIDDFGTGYSSLSYLGRLPVDSLKIDRSFIIGVADQAESVTIVTTIIALAQGLKLKVVAEGVETRAQADLLRLLRCDQAQGYLYSRPVPATEIQALLRADTALLVA